MERIIKNSACVFMLMATVIGCIKEIEMNNDAQDQEGLQAVVFHAGWAPETKTILQEDGEVFWAPGDSITLVSERLEDGQLSGCVSKLVSTNTSAASSASFIPTWGSVDENPSVYYAIYPYDPSMKNSIMGNTIWITIPTVQTAIAGSFDHRAFASYAVSNNQNLYFKNLCGGVKFSVAQEGINEISFRYASGEAMSGDFVLSFEDGELPSKKEGLNLSDGVIVRAPDNTSFEVGKYYYAVMYPVKNDSLIISYKKGSLPAVYLTTERSDIKRSVFKRLYNIDENLHHVASTDALMKATLPDYLMEVDFRQKITEAYFHPASDYVTDVNLGTSFTPVYFELVGTVAHYYTPMDRFNVRDVSVRMFAFWKSLTKVDLSGVDTSDATDFTEFFGACTSLKSVDLSNINTSNAVYLTNMFGGSGFESLDLSSFNTSNVIDMSGLFSGCKNLRDINWGRFDTSNCINMQGMFSGCKNLRDLNLGSFDTRNCFNMSYMFWGCASLQKLDLSSFDVSLVDRATNMCSNFAIRRKHCDVRASNSTRDLMCSVDANMPLVSRDHYITWIAPNEEFPPFVDPFQDLYKSSDYSKDKTYRLLQTATKGKGLDIVILGDAYTDRLIDDGTYDIDLNSAIENIFLEEPLKSLRDYFNVYVIYAVSENETYDGITAFDIIFEDGSTHMGMSDFGNDLDDYMKVALPNYGREINTGRPIPFIILIANSHRYAGTCAFYDSGSTIVYSPLGPNEIEFHSIICHEFGHAIGRLADEYYNWNGTFENNDYFTGQCANGFWPNIDVTSDPNSVKWSRFLQDGRYANQGLGIFDGGFANYAYGIWRPTENSIMNNAPSGFNAPCREAIYKRVNELADDSFVYDYETFVAFDRPSWDNNTSTTNSVARKNHGRTMRPLPPPVFIKGAKNPNGASTTIHN